MLGGLYLSSAICVFGLNLINLCWLLDLMSILSFAGYHCSDCSHSLLSDFCSANATNSLLENYLCSDGIFGTIWDFKNLESICDANGIFKCGLRVDLWCVNCSASGSNLLQCSDFNATGLMWTCELFCINVGICGAISRFEEYDGECDINKLLIFCRVFFLFLIKCLTESGILYNVATTKCSSSEESFF